MNYRYNSCGCKWNKYDDDHENNINKTDKCENLERISYDLTRNSKELRERLNEKIKNRESLQKKIKELEEELNSLRRKEESLFNDISNLEENLNRVTLEAFKNLFDTIECYKVYSENNNKPEKPERPNCGCGCYYRDR